MKYVLPLLSNTVLEALFSVKFKNKKTAQFKRRPMTLVDTSPKKKYRWQVNIGKEGPSPMSSGKCKLQ